MKKALYIILGISLALGIPILGLYFTNLIEHGAGVVLSIILIPYLGFYFLKSNYKPIGIGILIGLIPLSILTIAFIGLSKLH